MCQNRKTSGFKASFLESLKKNDVTAGLLTYPIRKRLPIIFKNNSG
jgi:hypothetical protein